jgi:hypothetical protein
MIVKKANFALSLYVLASVPFFVLVALPVLHGQMDFQFYLDSLTYHDAAEQLAIGTDLVSLTANYLGPVLIIKLLHGSYVLIYLLNIVLFLLIYRLITGAFPVNRVRLLSVLFIAPLLFTSLFSVNKEILAVLVTVLFASSYGGHRPWLRWLAIALSVLARWQMTVALLAALLAFSPLNPLRRRRWPTFILLVAALSVLYPLNLNLFTGLDRIAELGAIDNTQGSGLFTRFIQLQNHFGGYLIAFLPKATQLFVGMTRRWWTLTDTRDVMNNIILWVQSAAQLVVLILMVAKRRLRLSSDLVYLAMIIAAVISLSPIFATRYLLPVYVLFAIELALPRRIR